MSSLRLILLVIIAPLLAEQPNNDGRIRVKFRALSFQDSIEGFGYLDGNDFHSLSLRSTRFTAEQTYVGSNPLRLAIIPPPKKEIPPEVAAAQVQLVQAKAAIGALTREMLDVQARLSPLTIELVERGQKAPSGTQIEVRSLQNRFDELNHKLAKLHEFAEVTQKFVDNPPQQVKKIKPAKDEKKDSPPKAPERGQLTPLADVKFPGSGRYLLLVRRTEQGAQVSVLDDKPGAFPFGSLQFINLSGKPVAVRIGAEQIPLKPGAKGILNPSVANHSYVDGEIYLQQDTEPMLCQTLRVFKDDTVRGLYFIMPRPEETPGLDLKVVEQSRTPQDVEPESDDTPKTKGSTK